MKKLAFILAFLAMPYFARAQTAQFGPIPFNANASGVAIQQGYPPQSDTLGVTVSGLDTTSTWTLVLATSPDQTTWTTCETVTLSAGATTTATCSPQGGTFLRITVTAGTGGGSITGSVFGQNSKIGSIGGGSYTLPNATTSVLGGVKPDGTTCTTSAGVLTCSGGGGTADGTTIVSKSSVLSTNSIKVENTFASASTINYAHNLGDEYPVFTCYPLSGATAFTSAPVDPNTMSITSAGAATILCSFIATQPLPPNFAFSVTPNTLTYTPSMGGTQTPTFAIAQTGNSGYSGTATYSTTGLAGGMSSSYSPATITGSGSSTLSVSFPATQAAGTTTFNASATDGTNTHTQPVSLTISGENTNLIEGWQMNEGSGLTFNDSVGSNSMTATGITWGAVSGETGLFPQYVYAASGATTYAVASNNTLTNFTGSSPFSISFWLYINSSQGTNAATYVSTLNASGGNYTGWEVSSTGSGTDEVQFFLVNTYPSNSLQVSATSNITIGALTHVVVTYDGSKSASGVSIYYNGALQTPHAIENSLTSSAANSNPIRIGSRTGAINGMGGSLSYLRIYNAQLTGTQVAALYAAGPK